MSEPLVRDLAIEEALQEKIKTTLEHNNQSYGEWCDQTDKEENNTYFPWPYKLVSMIWNTSKLSASHLIHATAISVVDCFQFDPSWIFGLKMEIMACAHLVGGTTEQSCLFPDLIWYYKWYETIPNSLHHTAAVTQPFLLLMAANLALTKIWAKNEAYGLYQLGWRYNVAKLSLSRPHMIL